MKLAGKAVESFLTIPGSYRAALFYGPDAGLVRERARRIAVARRKGHLQLQRAAFGAVAAPAKAQRVELGERGYDIVIGSGLLGEPAVYAALPADAVAVVVASGDITDGSAAPGASGRSRTATNTGRPSAGMACAGGVVGGDRLRLAAREENRIFACSAPGMRHRRPLQSQQCTTPARCCQEGVRC